MTSAPTACVGCGAIWWVGQTMVYAHEMGTIVRCATCDNVLIRVARGPDRYWLDLRGVEYLQLVAEP